MGGQRGPGECSLLLGRVCVCVCEGDGDRETVAHGPGGMVVAPGLAAASKLPSWAGGSDSGPELVLRERSGKLGRPKSL